MTWGYHYHDKYRYQLLNNAKIQAIFTWIVHCTWLNIKSLLPIYCYPTACWGLHLPSHHHSFASPSLFIIPLVFPIIFVCVSIGHALHHLIACYICMNVKIFDFSKHIDLVPILVKLFGVFDKSYFSKIKIAIYRRKCWIYSLYNGKWILNLKPQINNKRTIWIGTKILGVLCEFSKFNLLFVLLHN